MPPSTSFREFVFALNRFFSAELDSFANDCVFRGEGVLVSARSALATTIALPAPLVRSTSTEPTSGQALRFFATSAQVQSLNTQPLKSAFQVAPKLLQNSFTGNVFP